MVHDQRIQARLNEEAVEKSYANPSMKKVLRAVPMLQWRRCFNCGNEALHANNMIPWVTCKNCGSADTRIMKNESKLLHTEN